MKGNPPTNNASDIAIFGRVLANSKGKLDADLAQYILTLGFPVDDQNRMTELAERNQEGLLSPVERAELMNLVKASHLLAFLHSQARIALKIKPRRSSHGRKLVARAS